MARKRNTESFGLSYLDVMCCGFGAIILLLMITRVSESRTEALELAETPISGSVLELQRQLFSIRGETNLLNRQLNAKHEQLSQYEDRVARLRRELASLEARFSNTSEQSTDFEE